MTREAAGCDYDYIIRLVQYLDRRHGIRFFIGSRDFDVLYHWWEKGIPEAVIREAIDRVVERNRRRAKPLERFSRFSYEVRKHHQAFLSLDVGRARPEPVDVYAGLTAFLERLPVELEFLRTDFCGLFQQLRQGEAPALGEFEEKLLDRFREDSEFNAKTAWFLKNLAPPLRRPEIERRYRLNYLWGKYGIPSLD